MSITQVPDEVIVVRTCPTDYKAVLGVQIPVTALENYRDILRDIILKERDRRTDMGILSWCYQRSKDDVGRWTVTIHFVPKGPIEQRYLDNATSESDYREITDSCRTLFECAPKW